MKDYRTGSSAAESDAHTAESNQESRQVQSSRSLQLSLRRKTRDRGSVLVARLIAKSCIRIGARFEQSRVDTSECWSHLPAFSFPTVEAFAQSAPFGAQWVAVEMGGTPLHEFEHPERAVYILGAEDAGLPASVVRACHHCVSLEGVRASSYNVAVAGTLVLYDRLRKLGHCAGASAPAEEARVVSVA